MSWEGVHWRDRLPDLVKRTFKPGFRRAFTERGRPDHGWTPLQMAGEVDVDEAGRTMRIYGRVVAFFPDVYPYEFSVAR